MEAVQNEVINNLRATFKETDLFKVYQVPQATARPISQTFRQISNDCILTLPAALRPLSKVLPVLQVVPAAPCHSVARCVSSSARPACALRRTSAVWRRRRRRSRPNAHRC